MNFIQRFLNGRNTYAGVVIMIAALILLALSGRAIGKTSNPDINYAEGEATIVSITEEVEFIGSDVSYNYTVLVDYTINGTKYTNVEYGSYSSSMKEGDTVKILYNVDDPSQIQAPGFKVVPYVVMAVSVIIGIFGLFIFLRALRRR